MVLIRGALKDFAGLNLRNLCPRSLLAKNVATLRTHICGVVRLRSKEKVIWVHARRVVAVVAYAQAARDWPINQLPRDNVCIS